MITAPLGGISAKIIYKNWDYNFDKLRLIRNYHIILEIK